MTGRRGRHSLRRPTPRSEDRVPADAASSAPAKRPRILIVEDMAAMRGVLVAFMEADGYQAVSAGDGLRGLADAEAAPPDLILLDVTMPGLDGLALLAS